MPPSPPIAGLVVSGHDDAPWRYRAQFLHQLVLQIPGILKTQDAKTGRFGSGIWIVTDQNVLLPLAVAWSIQDPANPYYHDPHLLETILSGGDALIEAQDKNGRWVFRKKDNSTWGDIFMPWTYSRWVRAYALIKDAMPSARRERWERALTLGYTGIAANELKTIHNIPTHHAMGLYIAGAALGHPEWQVQAATFLRNVAETQDSGGFWSEHSGPVVGYNFVYVDALGVYYGLSHDDAVLPALERAARFHAAVTYPDGSAVETVDERQLYHPGVSFPNVGFTFSPEGRGYAQQQLLRLKRRAKGKAPETPILGAEAAASYLLYGEEGSALPPPGGTDTGQAILGKNDALLERIKPWFVAFSAYHAPISTSRWIQDRQNLVSVFQDGVGLIVGGGNSKLTPLWSTFTVGDTSLLFHKPGEENPNFTPPVGIYHVSTATTLRPDDRTLNLTYGNGSSATHCRVSFTNTDDELHLTYAGDFDTGAALFPVEAHIPLLPHLHTVWRTAAGKTGTLDEKPVALSADDCGGWFEHGGWRITVPPGSRLTWPVLPHDQYVKDGNAALAEGKIVLSLPLTPERPSREIVLSVLRPPHEP